jgi:transposase
MSGPIKIPLTDSQRSLLQAHELITMVEPEMVRVLSAIVSQGNQLFLCIDPMDLENLIEMISNVTDYEVHNPKLAKQYVLLGGVVFPPIFPRECVQVLEILKEVYANDAQTKRQGLSPEQRLSFHQAHSGPRMAELKTWLTEQIEQHHVEPNSSLGEAMSYMLNHWEPLTLFLRQPGAPLDNNVCEAALKKAILNRKNAYFYKTENGAHVGDLFMSVIHTCELNQINPFEYLTALHKHADELSDHPDNWMPWNYRDRLQKQTALSPNG